MFSGVSSVDSYASGKEVVAVNLPFVSSLDGSQHKDSDEPAMNGSDFTQSFQTTQFDRYIPDLVTLSLLPKSQWQSLINLEIIKVSFRPVLVVSYHLLFYLSFKTYQALFDIVYVCFHFALFLLCFLSVSF